MIFSEIYGAYYKAMAEIVKAALSENWMPGVESVRPIVEKYAFAESTPAVETAIAQERWQIVRADGATAIAHPPSRPLTSLELSWLKAISLDPRIRLFDFDTSALDGVEPLFTPDDYCVFDKYGDGDPYDDPAYVANFRAILGAIKTRRALRLGIINRKGRKTTACTLPDHLEYSEKDDKFRLIAFGPRRAYSVNLARIVSCEPFRGKFSARSCAPARAAQSVVLSVNDVRNALERVMLHFSHFEKEAERIGRNLYRLTVRYDRDDEAEMVIRVLSFGPLVKVIEPESFIDLIKERLLKQKDCGL